MTVNPANTSNAEELTRAFTEGEELDFDKIERLLASTNDRRELSLLLTLRELKTPTELTRHSHARRLLKLRNFNMLKRKLSVV